MESLPQVNNSHEAAWKRVSVTILPKVKDRKRVFRESRYKRIGKKIRYTILTHFLSISATNIFLLNPKCLYNFTFSNQWDL